VGKGAVWDQAEESMESFGAAFRTCAERVLALTT
jgi:hypothetical protein